MKANIFLSYRREDSAGYALALYSKLHNHFEHIFMDIDTIEIGVDFIEVIEAAVASSDVLIALIGRNWLYVTDAHGRRLDNPNDFVRIEISTALVRNIRVIPILLDGARMPSRKELPESLAALTRRQALEISHSRFNADVDRLIKTLNKILEAEKIEATSEIKKETSLEQHTTELMQVPTEHDPETAQDNYQESISKETTDIKGRETNRKAPILPFYLWCLILPYFAITALLIFSSPTVKRVVSYAFLTNALFTAIGSIVSCFGIIKVYLVGALATILQVGIMAFMLLKTQGEASAIIPLNLIIIAMFCIATYYYYRKEMYRDRNKEESLP